LVPRRRGPRRGDPTPPCRPVGPPAGPSAVTPDTPFLRAHWTGDAVDATALSAARAR
jgi:hypothetical protein